MQLDPHRTSASSKGEMNQSKNVDWSTRFLCAVCHKECAAALISHDASPTSLFLCAVNAAPDTVHTHLELGLDSPVAQVLQARARVRLSRTAYGIGVQLSAIKASLHPKPDDDEVIKLHKAGFTSPHQLGQCFKTQAHSLSLVFCVLTVSNKEDWLVAR